MPPTRSLIVVLWATYAAGCGVDLLVPDGVTVTCNDSGGCPRGSHCSTARQCIPNDDPDEQPTLLQATALDTTTITLAFSKPMRTDLLAPPTAYQLDHEASVISVDVSLDGTSVRLATSTQRGRIYTVQVLGATDVLGRPLAENTASFMGIGTPLDTTVPRTVSPLDNARLRGPTANLVWTQNIDSIDYHVEIARDAAMTDIVARLDVDAASTATTVDLGAAGQYYWRVTSDASEVPSNIGHFVMLIDAVYLACPGGPVVCSAQRDATRGGDKSEPLTTFNSALTLARSLGIETVRVAATPEAASFADELSIIAQTVSIEGGYDSSFGSVVGSSRISSLNGPCLVYGASHVRLSFIGCSGGDTSSGGIVRVVGSRDVVLDHVDIGVTDAVSQTLSVDESTVTITSSTVSGSAPAASNTTKSLISASVVSIVASALENVTFDLVRDSDLVLDHTSMATLATSADSGTSVVIRGIIVEDTSHLTVRDSRLLVGDPQVGLSANSIAVDVTNTASFDVQRSVVFAAPSFNVSHCFGTPIECQTTSAALHLTQNAAGVIQNSVLLAGGIGNGAPIHLESGFSSVSVIHSTLIGLRSGTPVRNGDGVVVATDAIDLVDSLLVCDDDAPDNRAPAITPALPRTMMSNAVACGIAYRATPDDPSSDTVAVEAFNVPDTRVFDNFSLGGGLADIFANLAGPDGMVGTLDDDVTTLGTGAAVLARAGRQSTAATCGPAGNSVPCPAVKDDFTQQTRGDPPTVGATELP